MLHARTLCEIHHAGYYLAGLGLLRALARRWPEAEAYWDCGLHVDVPRDEATAHLVAVAQERAWLAPVERVRHPILAQWGRRAPHRWQPAAREWLATMPERQRRAELEWLLESEYHGSPVCRIAAPPVEIAGVKLLPKARRNYGMGTMFPYTIPHAATCHPGHQLSAWLAVLAWESLDWMRLGADGGPEWPSAMLAQAWSYSRAEAPYLGWYQVTWRKPMRLRDVPLLWRGRGRIRGRAWSEWLVHAEAESDPRAARLLASELRIYPQDLVQTATGAQTAEAFPSREYRSGVSIRELRAMRLAALRRAGIAIATEAA